MPDGFSYKILGDSIKIWHAGTFATTLKGRAAMKFLADVERKDPQQVMARVTGNYKRGNERKAK